MHTLRYRKYQVSWLRVIAASLLGALLSTPTAHAIFTRCHNTSSEPGFAVNVEAVGDFDGDQDPDYAIVSQLGADRRIQLYSSASCGVLHTITKTASTSFGDSIASADLEGDGHEELVIGEPGQQANRGAVHFWDPDAVNGTGGLVGSLVGTARSKFGAAVAALVTVRPGSSNQAVVFVGAPETELLSGTHIEVGAVMRYTFPRQSTPVVNIPSLTQTIMGSQLGERFGAALAAASERGLLFNNTDFYRLYVGAPGFNQPNGLTNAGIVRAFRHSGPLSSSPLQAHFTVNAVDGAQGLFGSSIDVNSRQLAIGAPGARTIGNQPHGAVYRTSSTTPGPIVRYYDGDSSEIDNGIGADVALLNDTNYDGTAEVAFGTKAGPFSVNQSRGIARITQPGASFNSLILEAPVPTSDNAVRIAAADVTKDGTRELLIARRLAAGGGEVQVLQLGGFANNRGSGYIQLRGSVMSNAEARVVASGAVPGQVISLHGSQNIGVQAFHVGARQYIACIDLSPGVYAGRTDLVTSSAPGTSGTATYQFVLPRNPSNDFSNRMGAFQALQYPFSPAGAGALGVSNCVVAIAGLS